MIGAISNLPSPAVTQAPAGSPATTQSQTASTATLSGAAPSADTVTISAAAKAMLQEARETPAQTAREAAGGDHQAQRLLAKEAAARAH